MNFLENSINELKEQRPVFHSEDDLKLSLAMMIKETNPNFQIRLEKPIEIKMIDRIDREVIIRAPIDIMVIDEQGFEIPIEIKYKTKKVHLKESNEDYFLANHGAADIGRYSFRKDIYRIEHQILENKNTKIGFVFILTNDHSYFDNNVFEKGNIDKHFSFHHGGIINKKDNSWNYDKIDKTRYQFDESDNIWRYADQSKKHWTSKKELFYKLDLIRDYQIDWKDYSSIGGSNFKYCLFKIERQS